MRDDVPFDRWHRRETVLVAIDATRYERPVLQYREDSMLRELNKVSAVCTRSSASPQYEPKVSERLCDFSFVSDFTFSYTAFYVFIVKLFAFLFVYGEGLRSVWSIFCSSTAIYSLISFFSRRTAASVTTTARQLHWQELQPATGDAVPSVVTLDSSFCYSSWQLHR